MAATDLGTRVAGLDWSSLGETLDEQGFAQTPVVLSASECRALAELYDTGQFRSTVSMAQHRFGAGEYRYFDRPLPETVETLRRAFYPRLAGIANGWAERLSEPVRYPSDLDAFLDRCHAAGQERPTPLIFRYEPGDWNALHQDVYGDVAFPFQVVTLLDRPGEDFEGGELVLVEQRPRQQSQAHVVTLRRGAFCVFTNRHRPVEGTRGVYRATVRHGVSTLTSGRRTTLGIIFHDAR